MSTPKLTPEQQRHVVMELACYRAPRDVRREIDEEYGMSMSVNALLHYDPTKYMGHDLSAELKALFYETREQCKREEATLLATDRHYRLIQLQALADEARSNCDIRGALAA